MNENSSITTQRAAEMLGVSVSSIYRMEKNDILHPIRTPGGQRRFKLEELEQYKINSVNIVAPQKPYQEAGGRGSFASKGIKQREFTTEQQGEKEADEESAVRKEVDRRNTLNDLNGTEWLPETKKFFLPKRTGFKTPARTNRETASSTILVSRYCTFDYVFYEKRYACAGPVWRSWLNGKSMCTGKKSLYQY